MKSIKVAKADGCPEGFIKRDTSVKSNVYKATLDIVLAHVADFYEVMLTVMCEKYGIPVDEALTAVMESPQMKEMMLSPEFRGLSYVDEADIEKAERGSLSPRMSSESLSPPVEKAASAAPVAVVAAAKKKGRPKKIVIVDE